MILKCNKKGELIISFTIIFLILAGLATLTYYGILEPKITGKATDGTCTNENQVILRLSALTNAHGENFTGTKYNNYKICYDDIFGVPGNGNRTCTGTNKVLGLSGITNAHAESPSLDFYSIDVCYGNLTCTLRNGACLSGEKSVVNLSGITNAHLAAPDSASNYAYQICCIPSGGVPSSDEYQCIIEDDGNSFWYDGSNYEDSFLNCNINGEECCPAGYECNEVSGDYECEYSGIQECSDYTSESKCNDDKSNIAEHDIESKTGGVCGGETTNEDDCTISISNCNCTWSDDKKKNCTSTYDYNENCDIGSTLGSCTFNTLKSDSCVGGYKKVTWQATWKDSGSVAPDYCTNGEKRVSCITGILLGFFDIINFVIAILLIIIFYIIVLKKRKKYRKLGKTKTRKR